MKTLFSTAFIALAALMISCGGNANAPKEVAEEEIAVVEETCCEKEDSECCEEGEECCEKAAEEATEEAAE